MQVERIESEKNKYIFPRSWRHSGGDATGQWFGRKLVRCSGRARIHIYYYKFFFLLFPALRRLAMPLVLLLLFMKYD